MTSIFEFLITLNHTPGKPFQFRYCYGLSNKKTKYLRNRLLFYSPENSNIQTNQNKKTQQKPLFSYFFVPTTTISINLQFVTINSSIIKSSLSLCLSLSIALGEKKRDAHKKQTNNQKYNWLDFFAAFVCELNWKIRKKEAFFITPLKIKLNYLRFYNNNEQNNDWDFRLYRCWSLGREEWF